MRYIVGVAGQFLPVGSLRHFLANPIAIEFCFGIFLAWAFVRHEGFAPIAVWWSLLGFIALASAPLLVFHATTSGLPVASRVIAWGLPATFILGAFLSMGPPRGATMRFVMLRFVMLRFVMLLGDASYAVYLIHFFVMIAYAKLLKSTSLAHHSQILVIPVVLAASVALGVLMHLAVEKRLLFLVRVITARRELNRSVSSKPIPDPLG